MTAVSLNGWWINRQWILLPRQWILFSAKKKGAIKPWRHTEELRRRCLSERSQPGKATSCMIPTLWPSGKSKTVGTVEDQWLTARQAEHRLFRAVKLLCVTLSCWMCVIIHLPRPTACMTPSGTLTSTMDSGGRGVMCPCMFSTGNKCPTLVGTVDNRGGCVHLGGRRCTVFSAFLWT